MTRDTEIYGCRSGIQKAIRRGQVGLAKRCFETIWNDPKSRQWLRWRLAAVIPEDAWGFTGEYVRFLATLKEKVSLEEDKDRWYKFILRLTIFRKNKDVTIAFMSDMPMDDPEGRLIRAAKRNVAIHGKGDPDKYDKTQLINLMQSISPRQHPLTQYEQAAINLMQDRRFGGGLKSDKWLLIAAMILIWNRGLDEVKVTEELANQKQRYAGIKVVAPTELPWYIFDMHTRPGKMAMRVWLKNYNEKKWTEEEFHTLWFHMESAKLGSKVVSDKVGPETNSENLDFTTHKWWGRKRIAGMAWDYAQAMWDNKIAPDAKRLVEWALSKEQK